MQYRYEIEHASANFALRGKEQKKLKVPALMEYGSVRGARSRYARPCEGRDCIH